MGWSVTQFDPSTFHLPQLYPDVGKWGSPIATTTSQTSRWEETYILTTFLILKFSNGVESGSCPLSFWITICCMILSSSSQYWTVLPLLLSKREKRDRNNLQAVCKLGRVVFKSRHPWRHRSDHEAHSTPLPTCVVRHALVLKSK